MVILAKEFWEFELFRTFSYLMEFQFEFCRTFFWIRAKEKKKRENSNCVAISYIFFCALGFSHFRSCSKVLKTGRNCIRLLC